MPKPKKRRIPDAGARGTRTTLQVALASFLVNLWSAEVSHLTATERVTYTVVLTGLITAAWVAIENRWGKAFLRVIPEPDAPLVDTDDTQPTGAQVVAGVRARQDAPVVRIHPDDLAVIVRALGPALAKRATAKKTAARKATGQ